MFCSRVARITTAVLAFAGTSARLVGTAVLAALPLAAMPLADAGAQMLGPNDDQPIQIQADSGIEWQQDAHL